ncbi:GNAT family protein [Pantoea ananatis]|uniref:GNAT family N-acetyltransferase n=1 Tax=Pantoea ananas TaxID=553 RepID=UPI0024AD8CDA|nr:GNAT family protein [Pantoea ananatis]MDI6539122.1 GNAT family protein [Pantoea ananatis]
MKGSNERVIYYKELVYEDIVFLYRDKTEILTDHFFFYINHNSPLGISGSDASSFFEEQASIYTFIGIYTYGVDKPIVILKFSDLDAVNPFLNLSIFIVSETEDEFISEAIQKVICEYFSGQQVKKIVCVVFSNEKTEIKHLGLSNFNHEVSYPQYYYIKGRYIDVEIYSLLAGDIKEHYITA